MKTDHGLELFREIPENQLSEICGGGGFVAMLAAAAIGSAIKQIVEDWDNFKNGLAGRPEEPQNP